MISESDQIQWGGGVVAEIFRDLHKRNAFAGGGRGSGILFFLLTPGQNQASYLTSARFFYISDSKNVTTSIRCRKKTFTKSLGGGMAPVAPPGYATGMETWLASSLH